MDFDTIKADAEQAIAEKAVVPRETKPEAVAVVEEKPTQFANVNADNSFTKAVDRAKENTASEILGGKDKYAEDWQKKIKDAALKLAEVEQEKAELERQNVLYHQELLDTQQRLNEQQQAADKWTSKNKQREFHYDGVKPIMEFVNIEKPMNLVLLYFLTGVLLVPFLISKLWKGTVGALISGAQDSNRPKAVKGFLWTLIGILAAGGTALIVYLALIWLQII